MKESYGCCYKSAERERVWFQRGLAQRRGKQYDRAKALKKSGRTVFVSNVSVVAPGLN